MLLLAVDETCRGKTSDGSQCPCLHPKIRKDQKDDEPVEAILQQPPSTTSTFGACKEVARRETNLGFRKQDTALLALTSHMAKVGVCSSSSKDTIKKTTAANLRKMGIRSIVMVTVRLGCMKWKVAPDTAKIEELRKLKLAVSKGTDGKDLQIASSMTKSDIDEYLRTLFPRLFDFLENHSVASSNSNSTSRDGFYWYLIVKSGKNMVKSSQEGLTGNKVLKTRHPAGRKWSDQSIYFGTILEVDPESFSDSTSEVESLDEDIVGGSDDMDESKLFTTFESDLDLNLDSDVVMVENRELDRPRTKRPQRKRQRETLGQDGTQSAEVPASNTLPAEDASTRVMLDEYDYELSDFGAPNELLPSTSTPAAATTTSSLMTNHVLALVSHATHKDLGSGLPQGFNMLVKPKHNPWDRK
ncbi:hypothetical protein F4604DRAFT_1673431 [Suillus subluteus]|nr:hypothetical protein F4604DRAFT_1673431 [Suillus subluteus]